MDEPKISVIIPVYNEEKDIQKCLKSLETQTYKNLEIILIDDGSTDLTVSKIKSQFPKVELISQNHQGPGSARNLGAKQSKGKILVFVDADMTFDKNFLKDLTFPIRKNESIGTFSKNEFNANDRNLWSKCWNINKNLPGNLLIPKDYPDNAPVFRAILKSEFEKVSGFTPTGEYTDDWTLSEKLGKKSTLAKGAVYYHKNPASLREVINQAKWIGKNKFISGTALRKIRSIIFYSLPFSVIIGAYKSIKSRTVFFLIFKIIYDFSITSALIEVSRNNEKYR